MSAILAAVTQRGFFTEAQIRKFVQEELVRRLSKLYGRAADRQLAPFRTLRLLATDRQQTWLVADESNLHFVLDDRAWESPFLNWSLELEDTTPIRIQVEAQSTEGKVYLGSAQKGAFFSKSLFNNDDPRHKIGQFLLLHEHLPVGEAS